MKVRYIYSMRFCILFFLLVCTVSLSAYAGGNEDKRDENAKVEPQTEPEVTEQVEPEAPGLSVGTEPSPEFVPSVPTPNVRKAIKPKVRWNPDNNMDYSEIVGKVEQQPGSGGVLPPAPGFRGYYSSMIATGYGDRMPGFGALMEYSWNRLGAGAYFSYRPMQANDPIRETEGFGGVYGLYRWLPFDHSPYILAGLEVGSATPEPFGGVVGLGMELRIYLGLTLLLGYSYHSTAREGFPGGALGWSF